jgi:hypothetical protein
MTLRVIPVLNSKNEMQINLRICICDTFMFIPYGELLDDAFLFYGYLSPTGNYYIFIFSVPPDTQPYLNIQRVMPVTVKYISAKGNPIFLFKEEHIRKDGL